MSLTPNKLSILGAIIILATVCSIASAQIPTDLNALAVKSDSALVPKETTVQKKAGSPAERPSLATEPEAVSADNTRSEVSDPAVAPTDSAMPALEVASSATMTAPSARPQTPDPDKWQFQFSPYFWLASLHGTGGVGNRSAEVDMSFGDIFGSLKFALMGVFEARKDKLVFLTDIEYVSIEDDRATPGPFFSNATAGFKTFIFDQEVGYRLYDDPAKGASVDVLGGVRVWHVSTDLNFGAGILPAVQVDGSRNWVDGIVGLRGKTAVSPKMFISGKFDLGGGGSNFTWQLFAGGGYNIKPNIALIAGYRVLDVNYRKSNFIYDMNQRGPIMGLGFKF